MYYCCWYLPVYIVISERIYWYWRKQILKLKTFPFFCPPVLPIRGKIYTVMLYLMHYFPSFVQIITVYNGTCNQIYSSYILKSIYEIWKTIQTVNYNNYMFFFVFFLPIMIFLVMLQTFLKDWGEKYVIDGYKNYNLFAK